MNYVERADELTLLITFERQNRQMVIPEEFSQNKNTDIKLAIDEHRILISGKLSLKGLLTKYENFVRYILNNNKETNFLAYGLGIQGKVEEKRQNTKEVNIGDLLNVFLAINDKFSDKEATFIKDFDISYTSKLNDDDDLFIVIKSSENAISLFSAVSHNVDMLGNDSRDMKELYKEAKKSFENLVNKEEVEISDC